MDAGLGLTYTAGSSLASNVDVLGDDHATSNLDDAADVKHNNTVRL